ncbi:glucokinase [Xaviernesmea oryzae]|uniref:glucokinase n=1 Tax=Xaviernesmea oryzae TaxID=464029 RepID=UPI00389A0C9E
MPTDDDITAGLAFPILIGDIGGTNARFGLIADAGSEPHLFPIVPTGGYKSIEEALLTGVLPKDRPRPRSAIIAVAGPIKGDEIPLTNAGWVIRPKDMIAALDLAEVIVINDFEAQALAVADLSEANRAKIGGGEALTDHSCVVLGPGTGLGVAGLVHARQTWFPVPGEGGHVDLGPRTPRDLAIWPHLEVIEGRISGEQILCGRGLLNLYRAICAADGKPSLYADPAEVTQAALAHADPAAEETLRLFATYLGRVAGDMAMVFMARGGVFLAGGIAQKILPALQGPDFRAAFEDKAPHSALLKSIPSFVVTHPAAALSGLSAYARAPERFGLTTEGRCWRP